MEEDTEEEEAGLRKEKRKPGKPVTVKEEKKDSSEVVVEVSQPVRLEVGLEPSG